MGADDAGIEINVSWRRPRYHQRSSRRKFTARAVSQPVSHVPRTLVTSLGCIDRPKLQNSLRRTIREIPDRIQTKMRRTGLAAGGGVTEASEQNSLVRSTGPTSAGYEAVYRFRLGRVTHRYFLG